MPMVFHTCLWFSLHGYHHLPDKVPHIAGTKTVGLASQ